MLERMWLMVDYKPWLFLPAAFAFIVLKDDAADSEVVVKELKSAVATKIAKYAVPDQMLVSRYSSDGPPLLHFPAGTPFSHSSTFRSWSVLFGRHDTPT